MHAFFIVNCLRNNEFTYPGRSLLLLSSGVLVGFPPVNCVWGKGRLDRFGERGGRVPHLYTLYARAMKDCARLLGWKFMGRSISVYRIQVSRKNEDPPNLRTPGPRIVYKMGPQIPIFTRAYRERGHATHSTAK